MTTREGDQDAEFFAAYLFVFIGLCVYTLLLFTPDWRHSRVSSGLMTMAVLWSYVGEAGALKASQSRLKFPVFTIVGGVAFMAGFKAGGVIAVIAFLLWSLARGMGLLSSLERARSES